MSILTRIFAVIGALAVSSFLLGIIIGLYMVSQETVSLPNRIVLDFDFRESVTERGNTDPLSVAMGDMSSTPLRLLIASLDRAAKDDRVVGLTAKVSDATLDYAQTEELRAALKRFRDSGKFAHAYGDTFNGNTQYWLASAFDTIWIQPLGMIGLTGPALTAPFAADALKKLGIVADMHQRHEFKGAADTFTRSRMSDAMRTNYTRLLSDINGVLVSSIAAERGLAPEILSRHMDLAPILAKDALAARMVDKIGYEDEFYAAARWRGTAKPDAAPDDHDSQISGVTDTDTATDQTKDQIGADAESEAEVESEVESEAEVESDLETEAGTEIPDQLADSELADLHKHLKRFTPPTFVHLLDYYSGVSQEARDEDAPADSGTPAKVAALIYVEGEIVRLADDSGALGGTKTADAETLVKIINQAADDDAIAAIILRINSPGGDVTASESIRHAIAKARKKGKYVLVSMGETAASGGYWIATAADKIVANATTMTGSIGVVSGKFVIGGLANKLGIRFDELTTSQNSTIWSAVRPFSKEEMKRVNAILDDIYAAFTDRVAHSRKLSPEQIDKVARGRVWTGQSAKDVGLVDEIGGLKESYLLVRAHLGLSEKDPLYVKILPEPQPPLERIFDILRSLVGLPLFHGLTLSPEEMMRMISSALGVSPTGSLSAPRVMLH